jgi:hypothetical protein
MTSQMRHLKRITFYFFVVLLFPACRDEQPLKWYKGNLHTHSYWSDGDEYPEMIMDWYKSQGYHFVGLSDHNILAEGEKWIKVPKSRMYEEGFDKYLTKYGRQWVEYKSDSGRVLVKLKTYDEYKYLFEDENFLVIRSEEITDRFEGKPIHMNATNIQQLITPQGGSSVAEVMQRNVDAVLKQRMESGMVMFPHINHPNFHFAITTQDMIDLRGELFFEIYNGHPQVHNYGDSLRPGTEEMWDLINIAYLKRSQPLLYGLATDDSHNYHQFGAAYSNAGRGWVMVQADSLQPAALIKAMENGRFYATTGVILNEIKTTDNRISVSIKPEAGVAYLVEFAGVKKGQEKSEVFATSKDTESDFQLSPDHLFVRVRITSNKLKPNPFQEGDYEMAWTQPASYAEK